jgi:hypothetical protein
VAFTFGINEYQTEDPLLFLYPTYLFESKGIPSFRPALVWEYQQQLRTYPPL